MTKPKRNYPSHVSWSKDLDYIETYDKIRALLTSTNVKTKKFRRPDRKVKLAILLILIRNGCRLSEGVNAFNDFIGTGKRIVETRTMKRGFIYIKGDDGKMKRKTTTSEPDNPVMRTVIIPDEISANLPPFTGANVSISSWARSNLDLNPHCLRYLFISHLGITKGISAQAIQKITMHATMNEISRYTLKVQAADILRNGVL